MRRVPALATALLLLFLCAPAALAGGQAPGPGDPNPLIGQTWWNQNT